MGTECDVVLSAIRRGEETLPKLRAATGFNYAQLHVFLYSLEFEWQSVRRDETADGFSRYVPAQTEKISKGTDWHDVVPIPPVATARTKASVLASEAALVQRNAPFCASCHGECYASGKDRNGRQRWRCKPCGTSFLGSGAVNQIKSEKRALALSAFREGKSVRKVAAEVGLSKQTAQKIREEITEPILCECGKDVRHQGWCKFRYEQSPARQGTVKRMQMGGIETHEEADERLRQIVERGTAPTHVNLDLRDTERGKGETTSNGDSVIRESEKSGYEVFENPPCGCGRAYNHGGRCQFRRDQAAAKSGNGHSPKSGNNITKPITDKASFQSTEKSTAHNPVTSEGLAGKVAKPARVMQKLIPPKTDAGACWCGRLNRHMGRHATGSSDGQPSRSKTIVADSSVSVERPKSAMAQVQVMGGVKMNNEIEVRVSEMANWPAERISEFFEALANVIEIPQRPIVPKEIKHAWSKDFETQDGPDGLTGFCQLYLVSMLHHNMEDHEKEAVWTLLRYIKRIQAHNEMRDEQR